MLVLGCIRHQVCKFTLAVTFDNYTFITLNKPANVIGADQINKSVVVFSEVHVDRMDLFIERLTIYAMRFPIWVA